MSMIGRIGEEKTNILQRENIYQKMQKPAGAVVENIFQRLQQSDGENDGETVVGKAAEVQISRQEGDSRRKPLTP